MPCATDPYKIAALELAQQQGNLDLLPIILLAMMEGANIALKEQIEQ